MIKLILGIIMLIIGIIGGYLARDGWKEITQKKDGDKKPTATSDIIKSTSTAIKIRGAKGTKIRNNLISGFDTAIDSENSEDTDIKRNIIEE